MESIDIQKIKFQLRRNLYSVSYYVLICHLREAELSTLWFYSLVIIVQSENSFSNLK